LSVKFWTLLSLPLYFIYILPRPIRAFLGRAIGFLWFDVFRVRRRTAIENIKLAYPELSLAQVTSTARQSLFHMGYNIIEIMGFPFLSPPKVKEQTEFRGLDQLDQALAQKRGVFILTAHIGNGDFATAGFAVRGYKMNLISKVFKNQGLNDFWFRVREKFGTTMIPPRKSSYNILKALKRGEIVAFVLDQYTGPPNGIVTHFFGRKTGTAFGLALLAQRSGAIVLPAYTYRPHFGKHIVQICEPLEFEEQTDSEQTLVHNTQIYCDTVEKMIRLHPEQWMWVHRRWKGYWGQSPDGSQFFHEYPRY
jgi:Kdo2-lipid IVA lauroyltransferase/acyltransferase